MRYMLVGVLLAVLVLLVVVTVADSNSGRTAVVDRLGSDYAVLLLAESGETTDQRVVDPNVLPEAGRHEGAVLYLDDDGYRYSEAATIRRECRHSRRFDALAGRLS
ncbi:MAG: DUF3006 domain-containing protein [Natronomonas sp.]|jgi:hypothetical protein|uniref:DUF3006 domain-containing protein n=1 Tax=Natronomonas sp. TaxID=2184060 RepID=UPI00286FCC99|nr:DUF3006 domain-containing protein [Natronomonas sp.]MDR9381829.1 DUF3006 domain-containing protein [Natronomonas sp.]MDR9431501.1 DUF3006 domain-containing protein [Natronomonas sp.]